MENKVESVLSGAMEGLKNLVDVDTVVGEPIKAGTDVTLIPISKITCGFASGGSGFGGNPQNEHFGGGAGGCVKVVPVCFIVVRGDNVRMIPADSREGGLEKLMDMVPDLLDKFSALLKKKKENNE